MDGDPHGNSDLVGYDVGRGVATLILDSDHNRNALSTPLIQQLHAALNSGYADESVRVLVLSHHGRVFSSGADLAETQAARAAGQVPASHLGDLLAALWEGPKPVIARVAGPARAGGIGLIAACDLAVCTEEATFAFTEVRLGVIPAVISATVLRRLTSRVATELYLTGNTFDGTRAEQIGLVTAAVPGAELDATVAGYVDAVLRGAPGALAGAKQLLRRRYGDSLHTELAELSELSGRYFLSAEGREGVAAYQQKRQPAWRVERASDVDGG